MSFLGANHLRKIWGQETNVADLQRRYFGAWATSILNGSVTVDKAKDIIGRGVDRMIATIDRGDFDAQAIGHRQPRRFFCLLSPLPANVFFAFLQLLPPPRSLPLLFSSFSPLLLSPRSPSPAVTSPPRG